MRGKRETKTAQEVPVAKATPTEKEIEVIEELNAKLEEAQTADGFFVLLCARYGSRLHHFTAQVRMQPEDCLISLSEVEKKIREQNPRTPFDIHHFKPKIVEREDEEKRGE